MRLKDHALAVPRCVHGCLLRSLGFGCGGRSMSGGIAVFSEINRKVILYQAFVVKTSQPSHLVRNCMISEPFFFLDAVRFSGFRVP